MDKEIIFAMLEDAGFTVPAKEPSLSEIIGTPSHLETSGLFLFPGEIVKD